MFRLFSRLGLGRSTAIPKLPAPHHIPRQPSAKHSTSRNQSTPKRNLVNKLAPQKAINNAKPNPSQKWSRRTKPNAVEPKVNPFITRPPVEPELVNVAGSRLSIEELAEYRLRHVKFQQTQHRLKLFHKAMAERQNYLPDSSTEHITSSQKKAVLFPIARTLMTSAKGLVTGAVGIISYHAILNAAIWSKYTYSNLETYHPELLDPKHITFTKLMVLVDFVLRAAKSTLSYYIPTAYDLYYLCRQSLYMPFQRWKLRYIMHHVLEQDQQTNGTQTETAAQKQKHSPQYFKIDQLQHILYQTQYRRLSKRDPNSNSNQTHNRQPKVCRLTGDKVSDVVAMQKFCLENVKTIEILIEDLEKLYHGCETIYMASFDNMSRLHREVERRKQLYTLLLRERDHSHPQTTPQDSSIPSNTVHNEFTVGGDQDEVSGSEHGRFYTLSQYFNLPTSSSNSSAISIDNSFLNHHHVYDQLQGVSGQQHSMVKRFLSSLAFDFTTSQTTILENNVRDYIYNVYHHMVDQLPLFKTKLTFGMSWGDQNQAQQQQTQQQQPNPNSIGLFWDFNIATYYDMSLYQLNSMHNSGSSSSNGSSQEQQLNTTLNHSASFPRALSHTHRQLESASLSICNHHTELSHTTVNQQTMKILKGKESGHEKDENGPSKFDPESVMDLFPLPHNVKTTLRNTLNTQLREQPSAPPQLEDLLLAANFYNDHTSLRNTNPSLDNDADANADALTESLLRELESKRLSPLPTMSPFSLDNKLELQAYLKATIRDLKSLVIHQYDIHHREIVPEALLRQHQQQQRQQQQQAQSILTFPSASYSPTDLLEIQSGIDRYWDEGIAHLTYNIALVDEVQALTQHLTSFLSPHYIVANPLYFSLFAKNQYSPHLGRSVERFVVNMNQDGLVAMGKVPTPYIHELNHFDTRYTADAFIAQHSPSRSISSPDMDTAANVDKIGSGFVDCVVQTAKRYMKESTVAYQYKRAQQVQAKRKQQQQQSTQSGTAFIDPDSGISMRVGLHQHQQRLQQQQQTHQEQAPIQPTTQLPSIWGQDLYQLSSSSPASSETRFFDV